MADARQLEGWLQVAESDYADSVWSSKEYERMDSRFHGNDKKAVETVRQGIHLEM